MTKTLIEKKEAKLKKVVQQEAQVNLTPEMTLNELKLVVADKRVCIEPQTEGTELKYSIPLTRQAGNLTIELLFGPHRNYRYPMYGVRVANIATGQSKSYLYNDFQNLMATETIKNDLDIIGNCDTAILNRLREYAKSMKADGSITQVSDLLICINNSIPSNDAKTYFKLVINYVRESLSKFPSERSKISANIEGIRLDSHKSLRLYGADIVAIKVELLDSILEGSLKYTLAQVKQGWKELGVLGTKNVQRADYVIAIDLGDDYPEDCILFRIKL